MEIGASHPRSITQRFPPPLPANDGDGLLRAVETVCRILIPRSLVMRSLRIRTENPILTRAVLICRARCLQHVRHLPVLHPIDQTVERACRVHAIASKAMGQARSLEDPVVVVHRRVVGRDGVKVLPRASRRNDGVGLRCVSFLLVSELDRDVDIPDRGTSAACRRRRGTRRGWRSSPRKGQNPAPSRARRAGGPAT